MKTYHMVSKKVLIFLAPTRRRKVEEEEKSEGRNRKRRSSFFCYFLRAKGTFCYFLSVPLSSVLTLGLYLPLAEQAAQNIHTRAFAEARKGTHSTSHTHLRRRRRRWRKLCFTPVASPYESTVTRH